MLDHGILNTPLSKRGNIDAQLDAYKRQQANEAKAKARSDAQARKENRELAKANVATLTDETLLTCFARFDASKKWSAARCRKEAERLAYWEPKKALALTNAEAA